MKQLTTLLLIAMLLIVGCDSKRDADPDLVAQAVAATLTVNPTATAVPTSEPTLTSTPTPAPTNTPTPIPTSTPTPTLVACMDQSEVQAWLLNMEDIVDEWNFESEILVRTPRISAAQASREVREIIRRAEQEETPECTVAMRDQLLMRMSSLVTSFDNFIEEGGGIWFAIAYEIDFDEFLAYLPNQTEEQLRQCKSQIANSWVDTTEASVAFWSLAAMLPNEPENRESLDEARLTIIANPSRDCARFSIIEATTKTMDRLLENYRIQASSTTGGFAREFEEMTSIFRAIVDEYNMLHEND